MKKLFWLLVACAAAMSASAQAIRFSNELYSEIVVQDPNLYPSGNPEAPFFKNNQFFYGFRDRLNLAVNAEKVGGEATVETTVMSPDKSNFANGVDFSVRASTAYIFVRPVKLFELVAGLNYDRFLPASRLSDSRSDIDTSRHALFGRGFGVGAGDTSTYVGIGRYGAYGATATLSLFDDILTFATGLPVYPNTQRIFRGADVNFALNVFVPTLNINIGADYWAEFRDGGNNSIGAYVDWQIVRGLLVKAGYTAYFQGGYNSFRDHTQILQGWKPNFASQVNAMLALNFGAFMIEADSDITFGNKTVAGDFTPFNVFAGISGNVGDKARLYLRGGFQGIVSSVPNSDVFMVTVKPGVDIMIGRHNKISISAKLHSQKYGADVLGKQPQISVRQA